MIASTLQAAIGALAATAFWSLLGLALARSVLPRPVALGAAPVIGWASFSAVSLPLLTVFGFSLPHLALLAGLALALAAALFYRGRSRTQDCDIGLPVYSVAAAALLALVPALAIIPKITADGVHLSDPIFDHSKIAIIDGMVRQGLPPVDPVFSANGVSDGLSYYYLWHFAAAELSAALGITGWEADIALTWVTAFASLAAMMGIAVWLSRRRSAAILVVALAAAASLRLVLSLPTGSYTLTPFLTTPDGLAGWLFQSAWAPQHLMSATCVAVAIVLIVRFAHKSDALVLAVLATTVAAGFGSSAYVGGITFAIAALATAPILWCAIEPSRRLRVFGALVLAALIAAFIAAPILLAQSAMLAARGNVPIVLSPREVLGDLFPDSFRRLLDAPAYWLVLLPIEFPAAYLAGAAGLTRLYRGRPAGIEKTTLAAAIALAATGLTVSWLLASRLGDNNDLGLRAVLPAVMMLIVGAAAASATASCRGMIAALALLGLALSLPDTAALVRSNYRGRETPDAVQFAKAPELWRAVRRFASPTMRILNNPQALADLTPWPVNMGWALLADRSSCFASRELALAFAPLSPQLRDALGVKFVKIFDGEGSPDDVDELAHRFHCDVIVVTPQDGAWSRDPFAASPAYRLAETNEGRWRIYLRTMAADAGN